MMFPTFSKSLVIPASTVESSYTPKTAPSCSVKASSVVQPTHTAEAVIGYYNQVTMSLTNGVGNLRRILVFHELVLMPM